MSPRSGRAEILSPLRLRRRDTLVAAAARIVDAAGVGNLDFPALAESAGCSRAVLYRYFENRSDLIHRVYRQSCQQTLALLESVASETTGLARLTAFVAGTACAASASVVVSETSMLTSPHRAVIDELKNRIHATVEQFLRSGQADGSVRSCNVQVVARAICSMLDFSRVARRWAVAGQVALPAEMVDLVTFGSASDPEYSFHLRDSVEMFAQIGIQNLQTADVADLRIEQILMTASRMFNAYGMENVTLDDVAEALNMTRGVIYHYFASREILLAHCLDRGLGLYHAFVDHAQAHGRSGLEKSLIISHLNTQALSGPLQPVVPWFGFEALSADMQQDYFDKLRRLVARIATVQAEGLADGTRRPSQDSTIVARGGAYNWMPGWLDHLGSTDPFLIADEITMLLAHGVVAARQPV